ncbi:MAG: CDP-diacylglycerol--glycerol-3-phosphate 3-phosphatidyltransferase [Balneolaceae bacterium]
MEKLPNILSAFRMLMAPVFLFLFIQDDILLRFISLVVFALAAVTDYLDGYYARIYKVESDFGIFLDPLADKFLTFAGFICLPLLDPTQFPWWAVIVIMIRDISITLFRIFADRRGIVLQTRTMAKVKTAIQMIYLYIALLVGFLILIPGQTSIIAQSIFNADVFFWGMMGVVIITVYSGIEYFYVNSDLLSKKSEHGHT